MAWPSGASRMRSDMSTKDHVVGKGGGEDSGEAEWTGEYPRGRSIEKKGHGD